MTDVHTVREYVELQDMAKACELVLEILNLYQEDPDRYRS
jgi:di/tripeptidase